MRVLHILNELKPSGAESMLLNAISVFKDAGIRSDILTTGESVGIFAEKLAQAGYTIHHIPFRKSPAFFLAVSRLAAANFQAIHLHTERANFFLGLVARVVSRGVVIRTIHSNFEFNGNLRWRRSIQRRFLQLLGVQHVSIGKSVQQNELNRFNLKTFLVPNWYDSLRFTIPTQNERHKAREKMNIALDAKVIVSVGNCSHVKNHESIIKALAMFVDYERPIYIHIGMEENGNPERALVDHLDLNSWVHFVGPLQDIRPALYASDVFIMPSFYEGFGIAAVEAMASGLPAILADVPGLRDFRDDTVGAIYAKPDASSIAEVITRVFKMSASERLKIGELASKDMQSLYCMNIGVNKYISLYRGKDREVNAN